LDKKYNMGKESFSVLAIGAHPDDLEISCGGTLAKYAKAGKRVVMVCVTDGRYGRGASPQKMVEIRRKEAKSAVEVIGAELIFMGYPDLGLKQNDIELRMKIVDIIRKINPRVIITHAPSSFNPDHRVVSKIVYDSLIPSITYTLKSKHKACSQMPVLYYMSTVDGSGFTPEEYVDITDTLEIKLEMLSKHRSQIKVYKEKENRDILGFVKSLAIVNGFRCGVKYAEGFRKLHTWTQEITYRLLP